MLCPICHIKEGEWQCQTCRRIVCANDARPTDRGVYCVEHIPQSFSRPQQAPRNFGESQSLSSVKSAFYTMLFLTIGLGALLFIAGQFIQTGGLPEAVQSAVDSLNSVGILLLAGMGFITLVLGLAYFALSRQRT